MVYSIILLYYYLTKRFEYTYYDRKNIDMLPDITILLPTHNEEKVISQRIKNILDLHYPNKKIKVIFIDDSTDSTPEIIKRYVKMHDHIHLIRFNERMGYSPSILAGVRASNTKIIIFFEAGSFPQPDVLVNMISHFKNREIGAVSGGSEILNKDERVGKNESLYLKILNFIRESESHMDSTFYIKAEAMAIRRDQISDIEAYPDTGDIGTSMAYLIRKKGYKCIYDPKVVFHEYAPLNSSGWIKQKTIRSANMMRILLIYKDMIFNPRYGKFGCLTLPFHFFVLFILPFFPPMAIASILIGIYVDTMFFLRITIAISIAVLLAILLSKNIFILLIEINFSLLKALYQIFFSKKSHDAIDRVESTRR